MKERLIKYLGHKRKLSRDSIIFVTDIFFSFIDFEDVDIGNVWFGNCKFDNCNFRNAILHSLVTFDNCQFSDSPFYESQRDYLEIRNLSPKNKRIAFDRALAYFEYNICQIEFWQRIGQPQKVNEVKENMKYKQDDNVQFILEMR